MAIYRSFLDTIRWRFLPTFLLKANNGKPDFVRVGRGNGMLYQPSHVLNYGDASPYPQDALACFLMGIPSSSPRYNKGSLTKAHLYPVSGVNYTFLMPTSLSPLSLEYLDNAYSNYAYFSDYTGTSAITDNAFLHLYYKSSSPTIIACSKARFTAVIATNCIQKITRGLMLVRNKAGRYFEDVSRNTEDDEECIYQKPLNYNINGYPAYIVTWLIGHDEQHQWSFWSRIGLPLSSSNPEVDVMLGLGAAGGFSSSDYMAYISVMIEYGRFYMPRGS